MKSLIIMACSKKKLEKSAAAKDFYIGQLFKMIQKLAIIKKIDYIIISGKYGVLMPNDPVEPYDNMIKSKKDIKRIQNISLPIIKELSEKYEKIYIIMGKTYRLVLEPIINYKYVIVYDKRGIGGYLNIISMCLKNLEDSFKILEKNTLNFKNKKIEGKWRKINL